MCLTCSEKTIRFSTIPRKTYKCFSAKAVFHRPSIVSTLRHYSEKKIPKSVWVLMDSPNSENCHSFIESAGSRRLPDTHGFEIGTLRTIHRDFQEIVDEIVN